MSNAWPPRPDVPLDMPHDETGPRRQLAIRANASLPKDGSLSMVAPLRLMTFTTTTLPDATVWVGSIIYVEDGSAGERFRGSNGTNWVNLG